MARDHDARVLCDALDRGVPQPPPRLDRGQVTLLAAGTWDGLGCVVTLWRRLDDGASCNDTYVLARGAGGWLAPEGCAGAGMPDEARCRAYDTTGRLLTTRRYRPLAEGDRGWPDAALWV